jgi:hypothetical protein
VGSWNPVVMTSHGRVPRPVLMVGIGVGIVGMLFGALLLGVGDSPDESKRAGASGPLQKLTTWDPPALSAKAAAVTVTPANPGSIVSNDAQKKKKRIIWHPSARRPGAPPPAGDKSPQSVSGRKIYTEL